MGKFQKGDKVRVISYGLKTYNDTCIVVYAHDTKVYVVHNRYGTLCYNPQSLELVSRNTSKQNNIININKGDKENMLMGTYKVAKIKFMEGKNTNTLYCYALYDDSIGVNDKVVVMSAHNGMGIAEVVEIVPKEEITKEMLNSCNAGREIIAKFDMSDYCTRKENRAKAKQLKLAMEQKVAELQEVELLEYMAEKSPALKVMLDEYKELIK